MILKEAIFHANDRSFTFASLIFQVLLHKYLKLPGEYLFQLERNRKKIK